MTNVERRLSDNLWDLRDDAYDHPERWLGVAAVEVFQPLAEAVERAEEAGTQVDWRHDVVELLIAWRAMACEAAARAADRTGSSAAGDSRQSHGVTVTEIPVPAHVHVAAHQFLGQAGNGVLPRMRLQVGGCVSKGQPTFHPRSSCWRRLLCLRVGPSRPGGSSTTPPCARQSWLPAHIDGMPDVRTGTTRGLLLSSSPTRANLLGMPCPPTRRWNVGTTLGLSEHEPTRTCFAVCCSGITPMNAPTADSTFEIRQAAHLVRDADGGAASVANGRILCANHQWPAHLTNRHAPQPASSGEILTKLVANRGRAIIGATASRQVA